MLKLSIIVPVYNAAQYLERCVLSLLDQDIPFNEYEIILINDGSTDNSLDIAYSMQQKSTNIVVLTKDNGGASTARNLGLKYAKGEYIQFVDADDYILPQTLKKLLDVTLTKGLDIYSFAIKKFKEDGSYTIDYDRRFNSNTIYSGEEVILKKFALGSVCTQFYSNDIIKSHQLQFEEGMTREDVVFNTMVFSFAQKICFTDTCVYVYLWNENSVDRSNDIENKKKNLMYDFKVAEKTLNLANSTMIPLTLQSFYKKRANSIVLSTLLTILKSNELTKKMKFECLEYAKLNNLYPINGKTLSLKSTLLAKVLSRELITKIIISYNCK